MSAEGKSVVLTNGCFDLLHIGHVRYLDAARDLGDILIVGVNSDRSTRALKGEGRPVTGQNERAEIIASLRSVDLVTIFDAPTAVELVQMVKPDIYVKGGDYSSSPEHPGYPPEGPSVTALGGRVVIIDLVPGKSTTETLRRVADFGIRAGT